MDSGIEARTLHKTIRKLKDQRDIAAVVFRVDSPGGDGLASDLVAEALREVAEKKPVIVSQGQVAGSGGYWISTYADTILATPTTVTGSIGVIGGWLYADGWSDKTGQTYDVVQQGERADLLTGYQLPLLGLQIPARPIGRRGTRPGRRAVPGVLLRLRIGCRDRPETRPRRISARWVRGGSIQGWMGSAPGWSTRSGGLRTPSGSRAALLHCPRIGMRLWK